MKFFLAIALFFSGRTVLGFDFPIHRSLQNNVDFLPINISQKVTNNSDLYFQIGKVTSTPLHDEFETSPDLQAISFSNLNTCGNDIGWNVRSMNDDLGKVEVIVDKIINIGKKIWSIIEGGKPVVNIRTDVAHALPSGIQCWHHLENWQTPQSKTWKVSYQNKLGDTVAEFIYRISFVAGGQYKGVGRYITQATISPAKIYVNWGFKFNVEGQVPSVFNIGTHENPVAGMQLSIKWTVESSVSYHQAQHDFFINGNGQLQKME